MLRFQPDGWVEGLLRPLILTDPVGGIYFELIAPDLRFALLALLAPLALASRRLRIRLSGEAWRSLVALLVMFYFWTFTTGNGRYFIAGLLMCGPLLVLLIDRVSSSRGLRTSLIVGALALQIVTVQQHFSPGNWAWAFWRQGPGQMLTEKPTLPPALFITITRPTFSILVPQFHPDSRWVNQNDLRPGMPEYENFRQALATELPTYVVFPAAERTAPGARTPKRFGSMLTESLGPHGLRASLDDCRFLPTHATMRAPEGMEASNAPPLAFWLCPVTQHAALPLEPPELRWADVFESVERRCPRFFPARHGKQHEASDLVMRDYLVTESQLYVYQSGLVAFRYRRALNATVLGNIDQVRRGEFVIDCDKLPGRYVYPWHRS